MRSVPCLVLFGTIVLFGTTIFTPVLADSPSPSADYRSALETLEPLFSFEQIALRSLGPRADTFTEQQKEELYSVFGDFLVASIFDRLNSYSDGEANLEGVHLGEIEKLERDGREYARLRFTLKMTRGETEEELPVEFRFLNKRNWKIYDVHLEELSLVETYRSQFASFLVDNSPADLIENLRRKAQNFQDKNE